MTNVRSIQEHLNIFEKYILEHADQKPPDSLYQPVRYILGLGGKRIRPLSVLVVNELLQGNVDWALQVSWSLELFHNFTLMHDDIMDGSNLRRSHPATHIKFGVNAAILSGDIMMIQAIENLVHLEAISGNRNLSPLFLKTATEVCEGQALDITFEQSEDVPSVENYLEMIRLKTAVLLASSFSFAALINPAYSHLCDILYELGLNLGIGFQIQDDFLDFYGPEHQVGKVRGGDILRAKKTILIIELWPYLDQTDQKYYNQQSTDKSFCNRKIAHFEKLFNDFQIQEKVSQRLAHYANECNVIFGKLSESDLQISMLKSFVKEIFDRSF